jgi:hypothetical protein
VNVPFDFVAGGETLPAGTYSVSRVSTEAQPDLAIRSDDKSALLLPIVFHGVPDDQAKLGFEHVRITELCLPLAQTKSSAHRFLHGFCKGAGAFSAGTSAQPKQTSQSKYNGQV